MVFIESEFQSIK